MTDFLITQGDQPEITYTLKDDSGAVDLTGGTVAFAFQGGGISQTRAAEILNAALGEVRYVMIAADSAAPGIYAAQWIFTRDGVDRAFPATPIEFEITDRIPVAAVAGVTLIRDLYEPIRAILGDFKRRRYEDEAIASVVRSCIRMGKLTGYSVGADNRSITPAIASPTDFAVLVLNAAKMFVLPNAAAYAYRLRSMSESFGEQRNFVFELENQLYEANGGRTFQTFQTFYLWVEAMAGVNLWSALTELNTNAPVARITLGVEGLQVTKL